MANIFKSKIDDYEKTDLDNANQLEMKVSEIIARDIKNEEFDYNSSFKLS